MNILEKLKNYLADENRSIVFGKPQTADTDVLSLSMGDSDDAELSLGDDGCIMYQTLNVTVYAEGYLISYAQNSPRSLFRVCRQDREWGI